MYEELFSSACFWHDIEFFLAPEICIHQCLVTSDATVGSVGGSTCQLCLHLNTFSSFISVAVMKYLDKSNLGEKKVSFDLQLQMVVHHWGNRGRSLSG